MKTNVVDRVMIEANSLSAVKKSQSIIKVNVLSYPDRKELCEFWIPTSTYQLGMETFINTIRSRLKHGIKLEFSEYSLKEN